MKKNLVVLSFVAAFALTTGFVFAGNEIAMRVNVPFDFYAAGQQYASGEYVFAMHSGLEPTAATVMVRTLEGKAVCILATQALIEKGSTQNLVRFNQYGDKHFLSSITMRGLRAGVQAQKLENELRAQAKKARNNVTIAMK